MLSSWIQSAALVQMRTMTISDGSVNFEPNWQTDSRGPRHLRTAILATLLALQLWSAGLSFAFLLRDFTSTDETRCPEASSSISPGQQNELLLANSAVLQSGFVEGLVCHFMRQPQAESPREDDDGGYRGINSRTSVKVETNSGTLGPFCTEPCSNKCADLRGTPCIANLLAAYAAQAALRKGLLSYPGRSLAMVWHEWGNLSLKPGRC